MELISLILLSAAVPVVIWYGIHQIGYARQIPIWITALATMCMVVSVATHMVVKENHPWHCIIWDLLMVLIWGHLTLDTYSIRMKEKDIARIKQKWQWMRELDNDEYEDVMEHNNMDRPMIDKYIDYLEQEEIKALW